jgi:hypothetical protein
VYRGDVLFHQTSTNCTRPHVLFSLMGEACLASPCFKEEKLMFLHVLELLVYDHVYMMPCLSFICNAVAVGR